MDQLIHMLTASLEKAIDRFGSKFFLSAVGCFLMYQMVSEGKIDGTVGGIAVGIIVLAFMFARRLQEMEQTPSSTTKHTEVK